MITSKLSSNPFFFTKSEQCSRSRSVTAGYKPPYFIPVYTHLYPLIPYNKTHNISPQRISAIPQIQLHPSSPEFQNYTLTIGILLNSCYSLHRRYK